MFDIISSEKQPLNTKIFELQKKDLLEARRFKRFASVVDETVVYLEESQKCLEKIQEYQRQVNDHAVLMDSIAKQSRILLDEQRSKIMQQLELIRQNIYIIDPSKPNLSSLNIRNQKFKSILKTFKALLENYINIILEYQRFSSILFENQIKVANPNVTSFDLERAMSSTNEDCPSVFVQILVQRGMRKNDEKIQRIMDSVQEISLDLKQLNTIFEKLSELRNEVNIIIERYRRRWPVVLREGDHIYIIDDDLNLIEKAAVGTTIDFDLLIRQKKQRNRTITISLIIIVLCAAIAMIVIATILSNLK